MKHSGLFSLNEIQCVIGLYTADMADERGKDIYHMKAINGWIYTPIPRGIHVVVFTLSLRTRCGFGLPVEDDRAQIKRPARIQVKRKRAFGSKAYLRTSLPACHIRIDCGKCVSRRLPWRESERREDRFQALGRTIQPLSMTDFLINGPHLMI